MDTYDMNLYYSLIIGKRPDDVTGLFSPAQLFIKEFI